MKHTLKLALIVLFASCSNETEKKKAELIKLIEINQDSMNEYTRQLAAIGIEPENTAYDRISKPFRLSEVKFKQLHFKKKIDSLKFEIIKLP